MDAARTASGGSGLGLSIVKAIIERHGGTIEARNDGGAVFELTLPGVPSEHPDDVLSFSGCSGFRAAPPELAARDTSDTHSEILRLKAVADGIDLQ